MVVARPSLLVPITSFESLPYRHGNATALARQQHPRHQLCLQAAHVAATPVHSSNFCVCVSVYLPVCLSDTESLVKLDVHDQILEKLAAEFLQVCAGVLIVREPAFCTAAGAVLRLRCCAAPTHDPLDP